MGWGYPNPNTPWAAPAHDHEHPVINVTIPSPANGDDDDKKGADNNVTTDSPTVTETPKPNKPHRHVNGQTAGSAAYDGNWIENFGIGAALGAGIAVAADYADSIPKMVPYEWTAPDGKVYQYCANPKLPNLPAQVYLAGDENGRKLINRDKPLATFSYPTYNPVKYKEGGFPLFRVIENGFRRVAERNPPINPDEVEKIVTVYGQDNKIPIKKIDFKPNRQVLVDNYQPGSGSDRQVLVNMGGERYLLKEDQRQNLTTMAYDTIRRYDVVPGEGGEQLCKIQDLVPEPQSIESARKGVFKKAAKKVGFLLPEARYEKELPILHGLTNFPLRLESGLKEAYEFIPSAATLKKIFNPSKLVTWGIAGGVVVAILSFFGSTATSTSVNLNFTETNS